LQLQLIAYSPPAAGFTGTPTSGLAPLAVVFTNTSIGCSNFVWSFGDGQFLTNTTIINVTHTYVVGGS